MNGNAHATHQADFSLAPEWAVAIFTARESTETLWRTLRAAVQASNAKSTIIDVLVNGNLTLASAISEKVASEPPSGDVTIRVWHLPIPDKAETWNSYLHQIWPGAKLTFFVDGYAVVNPDSLDLIETALNTSHVASCATGVPSSGPSARRIAKAMVSENGIHGNLYALPRTTVDRLRALPFRLPQGIYRTDPLMAAALKFSLDPGSHEWTPEKVRVVPEASWKVFGKSYFSLMDIKAHLKRKVRQAQGDYENRAIRDHLSAKRLCPSLLPGTIKALIDDWMNAHPKDAASLTSSSWAHRKALSNLANSRYWDPSDHPPERLYPA
jgi:hypothetical protein